MRTFFSSWFPSSSKDNITDETTQHKPPLLHDITTAPDLSWTRLLDETPTPDQYFVFALGTASGVIATVAWRRWGMRLRTAEWVTPNILARRRWIRGVVTSVGDADDFRLYHTPGIGWRWPLQVRRVPTRRGDLKDQTIHVRIAGVDAPEGAHRGNPGQPHAKESLAWLRSRIRGKTIYCQLISRDRYGRIVGIPLVPRPFMPLFLTRCTGSPLPIEMLRAGTAMVYTESGGEYGPWGREALLRVEAGAKAARRGMWKDGDNIETPGEYKKRYSAVLGPASKDADDSDGAESGTNGVDDEGGDGRKSKLLSRISRLLARLR